MHVPGNMIMLDQSPLGVFVASPPPVPHPPRVGETVTHAHAQWFQRNVAQPTRNRRAHSAETGQNDVIMEENRKKKKPKSGGTPSAGGGPPSQPRRPTLSLAVPAPPHGQDYEVVIGLASMLARAAIAFDIRCRHRRRERGVGRER